jgi:hypothetical protein
MDFARLKLAELEEEIDESRRRERAYGYAAVAIAAPQVVLSALMTATALLETAFTAETARVVVGYMGLANVAVHALAAGVQPSRRAAEAHAHTRALVERKDAVQLAVVSGASAAEVAAIYSGKNAPARTHAASSDSVGASSEHVASDASNV